MILLFDLDGTVLTFEGAPPGPGRTALERAVHELHGVQRASDGVRFAGGTDRAIVRSLLRRIEASDDERAIDAVLDAYVAHLEAVLTTRRYRPVGAVAEAIARCHARGAVVGIATGNIRKGARLKLASAGLDGVFDFDRGGFGCDAEVRAEIVRHAIKRCQAVAGRPCEVVVIGDTEHDVRAARESGARVVGVATSDAARSELHAAGADRIVSECGDDLVRAIFDGA
jgi:phosphoglycolate phosphatase-like HAD superfamily hydrolase